MSTEGNIHRYVSGQWWSFRLFWLKDTSTCWMQQLSKPLTAPPPEPLLPYIQQILKCQALKYLDLRSRLGGSFLCPLKRQSGHTGWSLRFQLEDRAELPQDFLTAKIMKHTSEHFSNLHSSWNSQNATQPLNLCKNGNRKQSYWQFLASNFSGGGLSRWGVQVTLRDQVLQQVDQGSTRVSTSVKVDHIVGATELKERLQLLDTGKDICCLCTTYYHFSPWLSY